jgi:hypothetical protein
MIDTEDEGTPAEKLVTDLRRIMAAVDQMTAKCDTIVSHIRRDRIREKWRNIAVSIVCALAGCIVGALVFGR